MMISVIIPVYNAAVHLPGILRCLEKQTVQNMEVLLVDDGSTDGSACICDEWTEKDRRFRCVHQPNAGVSAARNRGLSEAGGDYITFLDADDEIEPNYLEELLRTCREGDADIAVCDVAVVENGVEVRRFSLERPSLTSTQALDHLLCRRNINSGPCAKLFKREILHGLEFPPLKAYEDILFVKDAFVKAGKIAATDRTAYRYIQNPSGAMSGFIRDPSLDIVKATDELLDFIVERKDLSPDCFYITASHLMQYVIPVIPQAEKRVVPFLKAAQDVYRKNAVRIWGCEAFPWKEKIVYLAFVLGFYRQNKSFRRLRGR